MKRVTLLDVPIAKNVPREIVLDGKTIRGALGAFDFPERVQISLSDDEREVCLDLIYPVAPKERSDERSGPSGISFHIGRDSGRILKMRFPLPPEPRPAGMRFRLDVMAREPLGQLEKDAGRLPPSERPARRLAHYSMFPDLLSLVGEKLANLSAGGSAIELR